LSDKQKERQIDLEKHRKTDKTYREPDRTQTHSRQTNKAAQRRRGKRGAATSHLVRKDPQTERYIETDRDTEKTERKTDSQRR
jgi:hypothetical protein